ncbi:MAG: phosphodiester glycosidase family protein [Myxococcota bacterium]
MTWLVMSALAHDVLPERNDAPDVRAAAWVHDAGWRRSLPDTPSSPGTRVSARIGVPDGGALPRIEARGVDGSESGPWLPLEETFHGAFDRVAVIDLGAAWPAAELRVTDADEPRLGDLQWELSTPNWPDAGRIARAAQGAHPAFPSPPAQELLLIGVVDRAAWGARPTGCTAVEDDWYRMAIHHTAGSQTVDGTVLGAVQVLQAYAQDSGEYCDTPYQFLVGYDGSLWEGRSLAFTSGATGGGNNDGNIAVCFLGCYHPDSCPNGAGDLATDEMIDGGRLLVQTLVELHDIPSDSDSVRGHQDWPGNATACPGDYVVDRLDELRTDLAWFSGVEVARSHPIGAPVVLDPGEVAEVWLELENTGGLDWTPGATMLGTTDPRDSASALAQPSWPSDSRPATVDVVVPPGGVGRFTFEIAGGAPGSTTPASFGLVQEWVTWFGDPPWGGGPVDEVLAFEVVVPAPAPQDTGAEPEPPAVDTAVDPPSDFAGPVSAPRRLELDRGCGCAGGPVALGWLAPLALAALARRRRVWAAAGLAVPAPALAIDGWVEVHPGVRFVEVVRPGPIRAFVSEIDTCAPGVSLRATSPTDGTSSRVVSDFAQSVGAAVATNGDFFDHDFGLNLGQGVDWAPYLNGLSPGTDRSTSGNFAVGADRIELVPDTVVLPGPEPWMEQVVSGRWTLIEDGTPYYGIADGGFVCSPGLRHPRTVVGLSEDRRTVWQLVVDGRGFGGSIGITCDEVIDLMLELGAHDVMGLDGGGSSAMYVEGLGVVNHPSDGHERAVLNHLAVLATGSGPAPHCGERAVEAVPSAPVGPIVPVGSPGGFVPQAPARLLDTRVQAPAGASVDSAGRILGGTSFALTPPGGGASGAWLNVAATDPLGAGFVTVYPAGGAVPGTSNLNHAPGETVANAALIGLGAGGAVSVAPSATTHLVIDQQGSIAPGGAGLLPNTPVRLLDTRLTGGRLAPNVPVVLDATLSAAAASLTVAAVDPAGAGYLAVYPCASGVPSTSNLNFAAGEVVAAAVQVGTAGGICGVSNVEVDVVVDLTATWVDGDGLEVQPVQPLRLVDTRDGTGGWLGRVKPGTVVWVDADAVLGWPSDGRAMVLNVTVTEPSAPGFLTVYPCEVGLPPTSSLNYAPGETVASLAVTAVSPGTGEVCVYASGATHVVVDLTAIALGDPVALDPIPGGPVAAGGAEAPPSGCAVAPGAGWVLLAAVALRRRQRPTVAIPLRS